MKDRLTNQTAKEIYGQLRERGLTREEVVTLSSQLHEMACSDGVRQLGPEWCEYDLSLLGMPSDA
jgi:hypothetical protein